MVGQRGTKLLQRTQGLLSGRDRAIVANDNSDNRLAFGRSKQTADGA